MITNTTEYFVEIIAGEGMELYNGELVTNRVTAPIGTDLSAWTERERVETENPPAHNPFPGGITPGI